MAAQPKIKQWTREEIEAGVIEDTEYALGIPSEQSIEINDSLFDKRLDVESLDRLDLTFRLERRFGLKIKNSDLYPPSWSGLTEPEYVQHGRFTTQAITELRATYAHVDFSGFELMPTVEELQRRTTVGSLIRYVARQLGEQHDI
jgi:acyl carrier protein